MTDLKQLAREIFHETLTGVDIPSTFERKLQREGTRLSIDDVTIDVADYRSIRAVVMGKASARHTTPWPKSQASAPSAPRIPCPTKAASPPRAPFSICWPAPTRRR
jgi:hypothetical protein